MESNPHNLFKEPKSNILPPEKKLRRSSPKNENETSFPQLGAISSTMKRSRTTSSSFHEATILESSSLLVERNHYNLFFSINYKVDFGFSLYVIGDIEELGDWRPISAKIGEWHPGDNWTVSIISKPSSKLNKRKTIKYKWLVARSDVFSTRPSEFLWEEGPDRVISLNPKHKRKDFVMMDTWGYRNVVMRNMWQMEDRFKDYTMHIYGNIDALGESLKAPQKMEYVLKKLHHDSMCYWEYKVSLRGDIQEFQYQYVLVNKKNQGAIWEREPVRVWSANALNQAISKKKQSSTKTQSKNEGTEPKHDEVYKFRNGVIPKENEDFFYTKSIYKKVDMVFKQDFTMKKIILNVFCGPYPQTSKDIQDLAKNGIKSTLSLQDDHEMELRMINWEQVVNGMKLAGITSYRVGIVPDDSQDLLERFCDAIDKVNFLLENFQSVYIYSSAGENRAPMVVMLYLICHGGWNRQEAIELLKSKNVELSAKALSNVDLCIRKYQEIPRIIF